MTSSVERTDLDFKISVGLLLITHHVCFLYLSHSMKKTTNDLFVQQILSLGIRPVWSEFSLWVEWVVKDQMFLQAEAKTDQTWYVSKLTCKQSEYINCNQQ